MVNLMCLYQGRLFLGGLRPFVAAAGTDTDVSSIHRGGESKAGVCIQRHVINAGVTFCTTVQYIKLAGWSKEGTFEKSQGNLLNKIMILDTFG